MRTRFTERFGLIHAVALAPMAMASGGRLAAADILARLSAEAETLLSDKAPGYAAG